MKFENQIIYIRAKLNLTQSQLAKELKVSYATVNRWETGKTKPTKKAELAIKIFCSEKKIIISDEDLI